MKTACKLAVADVQRDEHGGVRAAADLERDRVLGRQQNASQIVADGLGAERHRADYMRPRVKFFAIVVDALFTK